MTLLFLCSVLFLEITDANGEQREPGEVLIGNELRDIAMDEDYVWMATEKGVNRYDRSSDEWKFFTVADGLVSNLVNCIAPERVEGILAKKSGSEVWFGTDSGVSVYNKEMNTWKSYTKRDGLIFNKVNAISARGDDVWIGTDRGVSVYDKKKDTWMSYSSFPGIPTSEVTAIHHEHAYAWIGTQKGLARYNYRERKWEYFRTSGSVWFSPEGGMRKTDDSPIPDDRINSIDGEGQYVYIATKSCLVEYDRNATLNFVAERTAYSGLTRAKRVAVDSLYRARRVEGGARLSLSRDRKEKWEKMGWRYMDLSTLMGDKRHEVSDNFLDVKYRSGEVWVATSRGLARFDSWVGERQTFTKANGLIDDEVNTIGTIGGEVWAGTSHGLGTYNLYRRSWKNYSMERALPSSYITALAEDKDGMWFATRGAVSSLDHETERWKTFTRDEGLAGANISSIAVVGNYVWFGTDEGVSRLEKSTKEWDNFNASRTGLVSNDVTAILVDGKYIWVGTKVGLNRYDDTTGEWTTYSTSFGLLDNYINALAADPKFVWIGTRSGLNRYDKAADKWTAYTAADGLSNNVITSLALDRDRVWAATKRGLNSMDRETGKWTSYTVTDDPINAIAAEEDGGKVWMGGRGSISRYELATGDLRAFTDADVAGLSRVNVYGVQDTAQYVWFATDGGIFRYNKADGTWWVYSPTKQRGSTDTLVDGNVQAIAGDKDFVYFGTPAGISRYDKMTGNWVSYTTADGLISSDVRALLLDGPDLWVGTQSGISRYDTVSDTWTDYTKKDGLPSDIVFSLALENRQPPIPLNKGGIKGGCPFVKGDGTIWAGTRGGAASLEKEEQPPESPFAKGDLWKKITTADGLPDNCVWSVAVDPSPLIKGDLGGCPYIWFGTNKGAARYSLADNSWLIYTEDDGLINNVVLSIGFDDKYVFLNGPEGATIYDKELGSFTPFSMWDGLAGPKATCIAAAARPNERSPVARTLETTDLRRETGLQEIWIGTSGGATRYDLVTDIAKSITSDDGLVSDNVQAIKLDEQYVWFGTDSGVSRYDIIMDEWITFHKAATSSREGQSSGLISFNIKSLAVDDNYLWVGTRAGLSRYDKVNGFWSYFPLEYVHPEREAPRPGGSKRDILTSLTQQLLTTGLSSGKEDASAAEIGSPLDGRASRYPPTWRPFIRALAVDGKYLWIGSNMGLFLYDKSFDELAGFTSDVTDIRDIIVGNNMIWLICPDKIAAFQRGSSFDSWLFYSDMWMDEEVTSDGETFQIVRRDFSASAGLTNLTSTIIDGDLVWLGREKGLRVFNTKELEPVTSIEVPGDISEKKITAMAPDGQYFWIGTRDGLYRHDTNVRTWEHFTKNDGLTSNRVSCLAVDDGYIWVGSSDRGVSRYDKSTAQWRIFTSESGLADNNVRAIAVDGKYVWFGTFSGGVCRYDKTSDLWTTYRTEDYMGRPQT
jgi:ligand-binding sensor domain-containing protein